MGFQRIYTCQRRPTLRTYPKQQNISMSGSHKMKLRQRFTSFTMGEPKAYRASRQSFNTIPSYPARKANPSLSTPILTSLIDGLFYRGIVPTNINGSLITPVYKTGDPFDTAYYRPIAVI